MEYIVVKTPRQCWFCFFFQFCYIFCNFWKWCIFWKSWIFLSFKNELRNHIREFVDGRSRNYSRMISMLLKFLIHLFLAIFNLLDHSLPFSIFYRQIPSLKIWTKSVLKYISVCFFQFSSVFMRQLNSTSHFQFRRSPIGQGHPSPSHGQHGRHDRWLLPIGSCKAAQRQVSVGHGGQQAGENQQRLHDRFAPLRRRWGCCV